MSHDDPHADNIVALPFVAAARAASAPALGRFGDLFGGSAPMQDVYRRIDKVAPTSATVLITGESGSGKEVVARTIHDRSQRAPVPVRRRQLRRDSRQPHRSRAVRLREGRVHRRGAHASRLLRARGRRHAVPRRSHRDGAGDAGAAAARARDRALHARRRRAGAARARARHRRDQPRPRGRRSRDGQLREDLMYRLAVFPDRAAAAARARRATPSSWPSTSCSS